MCAPLGSARQRAQLVEGSVPRDEVGLGEQWELLLLLLHELCVPEPARSCTTGFWANSTPGGTLSVSRGKGEAFPAPGSQPCRDRLGDGCPGSCAQQGRGAWCWSLSGMLSLQETHPKWILPSSPWG